MKENQFPGKRVERFTVGTIGEPGQRTFFLQISLSNHFQSYSIEKSLVRMLTDRIVEVLREIRKHNQFNSIEKLPFDDRPLETPIEEEFKVEGIRVLLLEESNFIAISLYSSDEESTDQNTFLVNTQQAEQFLRRAQAVLDAGRKICPFCSGAINPDGHICPRANGYRR